MRGSYFGVLGLLALGIIIIVAISVFKGAPHPDEITTTGFITNSLAGGFKTYDISVMNKGPKPAFCQGILLVTRNEVILKSIKQTVGLLNPGEERQIKMSAKVPLDSKVSYQTVCV